LAGEVFKVTPVMIVICPFPARGRWQHR